MENKLPYWGLIEEKSFKNWLNFYEIEPTGYN